MFFSPTSRIAESAIGENSDGADRETDSRLISTTGRRIGNSAAQSGGSVAGAAGGGASSEGFCSSPLPAAWPARFGCNGHLLSAQQA